MLKVLLLLLLFPSCCFATDIDFVLYPKKYITVKTNDRDEVTHLGMYESTGLFSGKEDTTYIPLDKYLKVHNCAMQYLIIKHFVPSIIIGCKKLN